MKKSLGAKLMVYPTPIWVIGTYDPEGKANMATAAWVGICCSNPPAVSVSFRKATYSYWNILERQCFTVNIPSEQYVREVDYFGLVSGKQVDKLASTGLTAERSKLVEAPYLVEFPFILECKLIDHHEIGLHTQFIGEVLDIKVDETALGADGNPDMEQVKPIIFAPGSGNYFGVGQYLGKAFAIGKRS